MHSRIAGTGRYLPAQVLTNDELARARRHERRVDSHAHRHPPAAHRRRRRARRPTSRSPPRARRLRPPASTPADVDLIIVATTTPDMIFPSTACILQAKLGAHGGAGVRRAGGVLGIRLRAGDRRQDGRGRAGAQRARRRRGDLFAHPRLERSRHVRAVRRRRRRRRARAVAKRPASCRRICMPTAATATSCACPGRCTTARSPARRSCTWTARRCSSSRCKVLAEVAHEALAANRLTVGDIDWLIPHQANIRIMDATAKKLGLPLESGRRRWIGTPTRRRRRFRWRSTSPCATAAFASGQHVMLARRRRRLHVGLGLLRW